MEVVHSPLSYPTIMKIKILYVEDEPFLGKIVKETLESQGYDVMLVADGALVMKTFNSFTPDICVLDVMLPNIDGFTLGKEIRKEYPNLPIIFLTAKVETDDLIIGFESGGTDYIKKPFSTKELIARIENQLNLLVSNTPNLENNKDEIKIGSFTFLPHKYELVSDKQIRKLSSRESEILSLLISHQNNTIDRKKLLMDIWGDDSYYNSRNLDVYIRKLRNYFANDPRIEIITLKGKGYHFVIP